MVIDIDGKLAVIGFNTGQSEHGCVLSIRHPLAPCRHKTRRKAEDAGDAEAAAQALHGLNAPCRARTGEDGDNVNPCDRSGRVSVKARRVILREI